MTLSRPRVRDSCGELSARPAEHGFTEGHITDGKNWLAKGLIE